MARLRELQAKHTCIGEVRGKGLMIGVEFVQPDGSAGAKLCDDIIVRAFHHGLLLLPCGQSTVRFMPPLVITTDDVDEAMEMLEEAIVEALRA
jgi:4-aminobutyrate aminotransferase